VVEDFAHDLSPPSLELYPQHQFQSKAYSSSSKMEVSTEVLTMTNQTAWHHVTENDDLQRNSDIHFDGTKMPCLMQDPEDRETLLSSSTNKMINK
jgi:hypothetical protein